MFKVSKITTKIFDMFKVSKMTTRNFDLFKVSKMTRVRSSHPRNKVLKKCISKNYIITKTIKTTIIYKKKKIVKLYNNGKTYRIRSKVNCKK